MGYSILDLNIDLSYGITVAYHNIVGIFDKNGINLKTFTLNDKNGKIVKMKRRQNMVVVCTDRAYFFLIDLMGDDVLSEVAASNSQLIEEAILTMDFDSDFFKGVSGNGSGEIITFEIL
jgi:tricorn protease-like protein